MAATFRSPGHFTLGFLADHGLLGINHWKGVTSPVERGNAHCAKGVCTTQKRFPSGSSRTTKSEPGRYLHG